MTSAEILTFTKNLGGIGDDDAFDDTKLYQYISLSQEEIFAEIVEKNLGFFETTGNISLEADTQEYNLPKGIYMNKLVCIEYNGNLITNSVYEKYKLFPIDKSERGNLNNGMLVEPGSPVSVDGYYTKLRFYLTGNKIGFVPVPKTTEANKIIVTFITEPSDIASDAQPIVPKAFHKLVAVRAIMFALGIQDNDDINNIAIMYRQLRGRLFKTLNDTTLQNVTYLKYEKR